MNRRLLAMLLLSGAASAYAQDGIFYDGYGDVVWNKLTGFSTYQHLRYGLREGPHDTHLLLRNEYYDTSGSDLPFRYAIRGTGIGAGYRYRFWNNQAFFTANYTRIVAGENKDQNDFRAGFAGYTDRRRGRQLTDLYGEAFYVERAKDAFAMLRVRPGLVLSDKNDGRLWAYGIGQVWASGKGENGTENRVEAGVGVGYVYKGKITLNLELRGGYSFRGQISDRTFFNPTIVLAGQL